MAPIVPRPFADPDASELGLDDPGRLEADVLEPSNPVSHCPELVEGGDVFPLQHLPGAPRQTQTLNRTRDQFDPEASGWPPSVAVQGLSYRAEGVVLSNRLNATQISRTLTPSRA